MNSFNGLKRLSAALGSKILLGEASYSYFGGTSYLGMSTNPQFLALYQQGLLKYGINNGTSRNNNVQMGIYDEFETHAADLFGAERAMVLSSGYLAAQLCIHQLLASGKVVYAPDCHPALFQAGMGPRMSSPASSFKEWAQDLVLEINNSRETEWVLLSNAMNNLHPEIYDFSFLLDLRADKRITLLIDDSHGIGINNQGRGAFPALKSVLAAAACDCELLVVASLAKGPGIDAGIVLGTAARIADLKMSPEFLGASPPAAAGLYAFMQAKALYATAWNRLMTLEQYFEDRLKHKSAYGHAGGFPVWKSQDPQLAEKLMEHQIVISAFPYPDFNGPSLNRIVLCSWHHENDLDKLAAVLNAITVP